MINKRPMWTIQIGFIFDGTRWSEAFYSDNS